MNLKQALPPGGSALSRWCAGLTERLKNAFMSIEDENILSLSASKLTGAADPAAVQLSGVNVTVNADSVTVRQNGAEIFRAAANGDIYIGNENGTEYVELTEGHINIHADSIVCDSLDTGTLNGTEVTS